MSKCPVCFSDGFQQLYDSKYDFSITSDNVKVDKGITLYRCTKCGHLQKKCDKDILENIYTNYAVDILSSDEKKIVNRKTRYELLCENIIDFIPKQGSILDVGTGSGSMLKSIAVVSGKSSLYGLDLTVKFSDKLAKIPRFEHLFTNAEEIDLKFDLITVVHTLEHIEDTSLFLQKLKRLLKPDGVLLVQVPNIEENIFDVFVYDHVSHFSPKTLAMLLSRFFTTLVMPKKTIPMEITLLCTDSSDIRGYSSFLSMNSEIMEFDFGASLDGIFAKLSNYKEHLAVFGTSPICTFFAMVIDGRLAYFIDEDVNRQGKIHLGVPIVSPEQYDGIGVVLPFPSSVADTIRSRLGAINFIEIGV